LSAKPSAAPQEATPRPEVIYDCPDCGPGVPVLDSGCCALCGLEDVVSDVIADPFAEAYRLLNGTDVSQVASYAQKNIRRALRCLSLHSRERHEERELLAEALDLVPRISDDDPMATTLLDWCRRARAALPTDGSQP